MSLDTYHRKETDKKPNNHIKVDPVRLKLATRAILDITDGEFGSPEDRYDESGSDLGLRHPINGSELFIGDKVPDDYEEQLRRASTDPNVGSIYTKKLMEDWLPGGDRCRVNIHGDPMASSEVYFAAVQHNTLIGAGFTPIHDHQTGNPFHEIITSDPPEGTEVTEVLTKLMLGNAFPWYYAIEGCIEPPEGTYQRVLHYKVGEWMTEQGGRSTNLYVVSDSREVK